MWSIQSDINTCMWVKWHSAGAGGTLWGWQGHLKVSSPFLVPHGELFWALNLHTPRRGPCRPMQAWWQGLRTPTAAWVDEESRIMHV